MRDVWVSDINIFGSISSRWPKTILCCISYLVKNKLTSFGSTGWLGNSWCLKQDLGSADENGRLPNSWTRASRQTRSSEANFLAGVIALVGVNPKKYLFKNWYSYYDLHTMINKLTWLMSLNGLFILIY